MGSLSPSNLAVLLIPGASSPASLYSDFVSHLRHLTGLDVYVYNNPSGTRPPDKQPAGLAEDAAFVHSKIEELADQGKDVVLLPHSYGGLVASEAAHGLEAADRTQRGLSGGVVRIIYLTCVVASVGECSSDVCAPLNFDWLLPLQEDERYVYNTPAGASRVYNDMPLNKALALIPKMSLQSVRSFNDKVQNDTYKRVPMTYILCEKDDVLTPEWQEGRIAWLKSQRSDGAAVPDVLRLDAGHFPPASDPQRTAEVGVEALIKSELYPS